MRLTTTLKNSFLSGVLLIAPLVVTIYVLRVLVGWSLQFVDPVVAGTRLTQYTANDALAAKLVAVVLIVSAVTFLGYLAQLSAGAQVFGRAGRVMNLIPLVNVIYSSVRQVATSLVDRDSRYESVVLVEYPREGLYAIGLVTGESPEEISTRSDGTMYNVFLPNSPNPTGGRLALVPEAQIYETDMSVRRGMRLIVTTGMGEEDMDTIPATTDDRPRPTTDSSSSIPLR